MTKPLAIRTHLLMTLLLLTLVPLGAVIWLGYAATDAALRREVASRLQVLADHKANRLEAYARKRREDAAVLSRLPFLADALEQLQSAVRERGYGSAERARIASKIRPFLEDFARGSGYLDLFLITPAGDEVFALRRGDGTNYLTEDRDLELTRTFNRARILMETELSELRRDVCSGEPAQFLGASLLRQGAVAGVVVLQVGNQEITRIVKDYHGLGETGETVVGSLVDQHVMFEMATRHDQKAAFSRRIRVGDQDLLPVQWAVDGIKGRGEAVDYRGRAVVAAWRYLPSLDWGLVVKIDAEEAYASLTRLRQWAIMLGLGTFTAILIVGLPLSGSLARPLVRLTRVVRQIADGDLQQTVPVVGPREIGELALGFNKMTADLRRLYSTMEEQVRERTAELHSQTELVNLLQQVATAANESPTLNEALQLGLDKVCTYTGWPVGHVYLRSESNPNELVSSAVWHLNQPEEHRAFHQVTEMILRSSGQGLPGLVLASGQPMWIMNVTLDAGFSYFREAVDLGINGVFDFPVLAGQEVVGVLEFFAREPKEPDLGLLEAMRSIGTQLGRVFERQRAEQALRLSERRYRQLTEGASDAIIVADQRGIITLFNPAAQELFGYSESEAVGKPITLLMLAEYREKHEAGLQRYVETRQARIVGSTCQLQGIRKTGEVFPLELSLSALELTEGVVFLGSIRDMTESYRMRARLVQAEKMASLGLLSAGVAHEINNPLAYVAGNLAAIERDVLDLVKVLTLHDLGRDSLAAAQPKLAERISALEEEIDLSFIRSNIGTILKSTRDGTKRIADIVKNLRGFARLDRAKRDRINLHDAVEQSLEMIRGRLSHRKITVMKDFGDLPLVTCAPAEINQVVLNLLVNAMQAIEATGREDGRISIRTRADRDTILIEIEDNGRGIASDDLPRVFDPFFTTKPQGEGTGLGLSISHGIIADHAGRLDVESIPGQGSTFRIVLPLITKDVVS
jgi:PAS domain S-box-containing protein